MLDEIILYGLKQISSTSGITYYRNFRDYTWIDKVDERCLLTKQSLVEEIQGQFTDYTEIVMFFLKEIR